MLRKHGHQWAHFIFDNVARLAFTQHVLAADEATNSEDGLPLHIIVDEATVLSRNILAVLQAFLGRNARARMALLQHCAADVSAFEHALRHHADGAGGLPCAYIYIYTHTHTYIYVHTYMA